MSGACSNEKCGACSNETFIGFLINIGTVFEWSTLYVALSSTRVLACDGLQQAPACFALGVEQSKCFQLLARTVPLRTGCLCISAQSWHGACFGLRLVKSSCSVSGSALISEKFRERANRALPKGPSRTKKHNPHIYYVVNPSLRAEMPVKPRKMMSAERVRDSKCLCNGKFTTRSKVTIA